MSEPLNHAPNLGLIEKLEALLKDARDGNVDFMVYAAAMVHGETTIACASGITFPDTPRTAASGVLLNSGHIMAALEALGGDIGRFMAEQRRINEENEKAEAAANDV